MNRRKRRCETRAPEEGKPQITGERRAACAIGSSGRGSLATPRAELGERRAGRRKKERERKRGKGRKERGADGVENMQNIRISSAKEMMQAWCLCPHNFSILENAPPPNARIARRSSSVRLRNSALACEVVDAARYTHTERERERE